MESESASARYKVKNQQTNYYIFSDGTESNGDNVIGAHNNVNNIIVTVNPAVDTGPTLISATIRGKAGLYASVSTEGIGQYIKWSNRPYVWQVAHNAAAGYYEIFVPGKDLYWFDNARTRAHFILENGAAAREREILFDFVRVLP